MRQLYFVIFLVTVAVLSGCANNRFLSSRFEDEVQKNGDIRLEGWARSHGELMIYASQEDMMRGSKYPLCISGRFDDTMPRDLRIFDKKRVKVEGKLFDYASLPNDDAPILQRKLLMGQTIPNFCLGKKVLLLKDVQIHGE